MKTLLNEIFKVFIRITVAILFCLILFAINFLIGGYLRSQTNPFLSNIWTVSSANFAASMLIFVLLMLALSRGKISTYGLKITSNIQLKRTTILGLSVGIVFTLIGLLFPFGENPATANFSFIQIVIFVWIYASISEEVLTRGLIQSYLEPLTRYGFTVFELRISLPVLTSAIIFALLHMGLLSTGMGINSVLYIVLFAFIVGLIAAFYREKTGSLIPAIIVHIFANIGGTCTAYGLEIIKQIS
ncbi:MAG: CPBP family intramembrane metalloprotease [Bacteroidales bacterium]|nr:CPBP family intramembrane metalloprotease [Bacteroidales bacterium]